MNKDSQIKKNIIRDVEEFGWHVIKIMKDETGPAFAYSVGFIKRSIIPKFL